MRYYCEADHYCEEFHYDKELGYSICGANVCSHGDVPCGYIATVKYQGHWYCELHYEALMAGETLYLNVDVMEDNRRRI